MHPLQQKSDGIPPQEVPAAAQLPTGAIVVGCVTVGALVGAGVEGEMGEHTNFLPFPDP